MEKLILPKLTKNLLLHSCCAPCSCSIMKRLIESNINYVVFFYNPNIYPQAEYEKRKKEIKNFSKKHNIKFIDADYDNDFWIKKTIKFKNEPEKGLRCNICFDIRFLKTACFANENNFDVFTSSLGISKWKDFVQVTKAGIAAASKYPNLVYWDYNWRKAGGFDEAVKISKQENFYRQKYCGCIYSMKCSK